MFIHERVFYLIRGVFVGVVWFEPFYIDCAPLLENTPPALCSVFNTGWDWEDLFFRACTVGDRVRAGAEARLGFCGGCWLLRNFYSKCPHWRISMALGLSLLSSKPQTKQGSTIRGFSNAIKKWRLTASNRWEIKWESRVKDIRMGSWTPSGLHV